MSRLSAGIKVLHMLCHNLNEIGYRAFITQAHVQSEPEIGFPPILQTLNTGGFFADLRTPFLTEEILRYYDEYRLTPIVIYPEIYDNPLKAKFFGRYILNYPGLLAPFFCEKENFSLAYSQILAEALPRLTSGRSSTSDVLFVPTCDLEFWTPPASRVERKGTAFYAGKFQKVLGGIADKHPQGAVEILYSDEMTKLQIRDIFRSVEIFYCYEDTALAIEARLCGCPVVFVPNRHFDGMGLATNEVGTDGATLIGIEGGIEWAKSTVDGFRPRLRETIDRVPSQIAALASRWTGLANEQPYQGTIAPSYISQIMVRPRPVDLGHSTNFTPPQAKRVAIFAHFDAMGIIDDYVIYYLRELRNFVEKIVFVSDSELAQGETAKLAGLAEVGYASPHGEYDFGSWKRGLAYLGFDLAPWEELVIANDSCFAPIFPFGEVFANADGCDFWGATKEPYNRIASDWGLEPDDQGFDFLNSYFMVFKRQIITDAAFTDFWRSIGPQDAKSAVIDLYEVGLTRLLCGLGYKFKALADRDATLFYACNLPWARRMIFTKNGEGIEDLDQQLWIIDKYFPRELIDRYVSRVMGFLPYKGVESSGATAGSPILDCLPIGVVFEIAKLSSTIGLKKAGSKTWNYAMARRWAPENHYGPVEESHPVLDRLPIALTFEIAKFSSTIGLKRYGSRIWNYAMSRRASLDA